MLCLLHYLVTEQAAAIQQSKFDAGVNGITDVIRLRKNCNSAQQVELFPGNFLSNSSL